MRKFRLKRLLLVGISNIASGIFFGTGCILIEHADNTWWNAETPTEQEEAASSTATDEEVVPTKHPTVGLTAIKPATTK